MNLVTAAATATFAIIVGGPSAGDAPAVSVTRRGGVIGAADGAAARRARLLRVGSKAFTESVILGEIVAHVARAAGSEVQHRAGLGGTRLLWNALTTGAIDIYPEYTGTLVQEILGAAAIADADADDATADSAAPRTAAAGASGRDGSTVGPLAATLAARGIGIIGPLGFNNTYAIGMNEKRATELGLTAISDLRGHPELRFGFSSEFMSRRDGWPSLRARYDLPQTNVTGLDHELAHRGLAAGDLDAIDLYATDAEIRQHRLRVLTDDRHIFPRYDAVLLYRLDFEKRGGGRDVIAALRRLQGRIDAPTMTALNARAKIGRVPESSVAADFLASTFHLAGGDGGAGRSAAAAADVFRHAREHLALVALSLFAAILVAVPLGIVAALRPRLGQVVLGAVGVIQTIPTLALLVFMIPLIGIGAFPAVAALFLYSLLPIVRNTHAGLRNIAPGLRDSAEALGLPPGASLRLVLLPLASPLILAGIKSAAVINVGTATLGALIGAGGFGQPIFTGIRLDDVGLILQGAIPASLMALAMQGGFELVERWLVPRGLRSRAT